MATNGDIILSASGLTKVFGGFAAVNGVDLAVKRGTIHALIGPNGAGKTTCFNLLTKFLTPTQGSIHYKGQDITASQPAEIGRASTPTAPADPSCTTARVMALPSAPPARLSGPSSNAVAWERIDSGNRL